MIAVQNTKYLIRKWSLLLLILSSLAQTSCKKILDVVSPNEVDDNTVFTSVDGLRNARIGMYSSLQDRNYYGGYYQLVAESYTDNGSTGGYDLIDLNDLAGRTVSPTNIYIQQNYNAIYSTIYVANKVINNIDIVPNLSSEEHDNTLAEALFIRSLANFDLLRFWGEHWDKSSAYGISIVTNTDAPAQSVARSTVEQSYQQIFTDLLKAKSLFNSYQGNQYASLAATNALLARVYLYHGDMQQAADYATEVINDNNYALFDAADFQKIYTNKLTEESVFELKFDPQNTSFFNGATYLRDDALRSDVTFLANADLNTFFESRPDDQRSALVDFINNDVSIEPDGRSQKYRGETAKDNSAYIIRLAEMYLIRAEALGSVDGLADLNTIREARGMTELTNEDVAGEGAFITAVLDERRAELNFEGHRLFDLVRLGKVDEYLGEGVNPIMPIPQREISATNSLVTQNPGY
ncbi:RagB/SusD family nutrient uptake outer membrane protein [Limnovirga soli]|uniref:RagB/SusD family nutrient uptake outer membrane protein n=1 Tax=Limnovirga soli TaxID=2656915 RepID=A0A8J8FGP5_9BACT|nr:RagB/SusD family nutrient uptake outer membrane protein [Limnovirga soli]NNV57325.1 RagB/SusD family nutrient uptake outer membrane protein [Limnovirga soli]